MHQLAALPSGLSGRLWLARRLLGERAGPPIRFCVESANVHIYMYIITPVASAKRARGVLLQVHPQLLSRVPGQYTETAESRASEVQAGTWFAGRFHANRSTG